MYAIDPTGFNFTEAEVTATAKGNRLYKCKDWNFTEQRCYGEWTLLQSIAPGEDYTFTLTPEDPGLAEGGGTFFDDFESYYDRDLQTAMISMNRQKVILYLTIFGLSMNVAMNLVLIPQIGFLGAASTTVFVEAFLFSLLFLYVQKNLAHTLHF